MIIEEEVSRAKEGTGDDYSPEDPENLVNL